MKLVVDGIIYSLQAHGGISRLFSELLPRMCELDPRLEVVLLTDRRLGQALPRHERIRRRVVPRIEKRLRPKKLWRPVAPAIYSWIRQLYTGFGKNQIWHSTLYTETVWWRGARVVTVADMTHERFPNLFNEPRDERLRAGKRKCLSHADAVVCISESTAADLQRFYRVPPERVHVIHLASNDSFKVLCNVKQLQELRPFLLYVGDRNHYKNFVKLLDAYAVWPRRKEVMLVVVGREWTKQEQSRLEKQDIVQHVRLLGQVSDEDLCRLYNQAAALVYPSLYEGFGIPLLEAMACGCPIVASRIPSTVEVAGDLPIYFNPRETDELVAAVDEVLAEGRESARTQAGLQHVQRYSWEATARQTLEVYNSVL